MSGNKIVYNESAAGAKKIELSGVKGTPTLSGSTVFLNAENFDGDVEVKRNKENYAFNLSGQFAGEKFISFYKAETIKTSGSNVTINGNAGDDSLVGDVSNDYLIGGKSNDTFDGGAGNDTLSGGKGHDVFLYSGGNDVITDYEKKDIISLTSAYENFSVNGSDVIFNFGDDNTLTLINGAGKEINFQYSENTSNDIYITEGVLDKKKHSVELKATAESFNAAEYSRLQTIDGSAAEDAINIVGNRKRNLICAGANGSSLAGGKGRDTLRGGEGSDIFIYSKGDGVDVIDNCDAGDKISLGSDVTINDAKFMQGNTFFKFKGSGSLTVNGTASVTLTTDGNDSIFSGGVFHVGDTVKVLGSYKDAIDLAADFKNVDATLSKQKLTINGNDADNSLVGGKGKDSLIGGAGNDTLWGGKRNDTLTGGEGNDVFIFRAGDTFNINSESHIFNGKSLE